MKKSLVLLLVLAWASLAAAQTGEQGEIVGSSAEIRISMPKDQWPRVVVDSGEREILLELPAGAQYPEDFAEASGGLIRSGTVEPVGTDRLGIRLEMGYGLVDRIIYEPDGIVLRIRSSYETAAPIAQVDSDQYLLGFGDRISMVVHNHPELNIRLTVTQEGTITAPLVGDVQAAGLTPRQLAARLTDRLGRAYLVDPQVDVEVDEYRSQWVMVTGEVHIPGRIALRGGTRLKEVLAEAGGFTETSGERIVVSRKVEGSEEYRKREIERILFETGEINPMLRPGDIIEVSRAAICYLQGEVRAPGSVVVERYMTLLKAISVAGGLTEWAERKSVRVLYPPGTEPRELIFNLKKIQKGKADDPPLVGGEVIIVQRRFF